MWKATAVLRGEHSLPRKSTLITLDKLCFVVPTTGRAPLSILHQSVVALIYTVLRLCRNLPVVLQALFCS